MQTPCQVSGMQLHRIFFYGNIIEFCPLTGKLVLPDRVATRPEVLSKPLLNFKVKLADYPSSLCTYIALASRAVHCRNMAGFTIIVFINSQSSQYLFPSFILLKSENELAWHQYKPVRLSLSLQELINTLLSVDASKRITAAGALKHPWIVVSI